MTIHGLVNTRFLGSSVQSRYADMYVSLTRFLTSSFAQAAGIERIAYNTGSGGAGENFLGEQGAIASNAWSCYRFLSASIPFYMLLQLNTTNNPNTAPGAPGAFDGTTYSGVAVAFAMRSNGASPWNGSVARSGSDFKGTPVWSGSSDLFLWPRSNNTNGAHSVNRENMMGIPYSSTVDSGIPSLGSRIWMICDEDHVLFAADYDATNSVRLLYFGPYTPRPDVNLLYPYVCLRNALSTEASLLVNSTFGGTTSGQATADGGIAHPIHAASGTRTAGMASLSTFWQVAYQPSFITASGSTARFDEWPLFVGIEEPSTQKSYLGYIDWIRYIWGPSCGEKNPEGNRAYLGNVTPYTAKISVPWPTQHEVFGGTDRTGSIF